MVAYALLLFAVITGVAILTSRTAITRLAEMGLVPQAFVHLVPVLTLAARTVAIALIVVGLGQLAFVSGWLSEAWLARYGFAAVLLILGAALLGMTFRSRKA